MSKIKIGINGFGRIGKLILRRAIKDDDVVVKTINDPYLSIENLEYLIKYDSVHGKFNSDISIVDDNTIMIDNKAIKFFNEKEPEKINWDNNDVEYVIDSSGVFTDYKSAKKHLVAGAKKVIVSAPGKNMPMFVMGVNENNYTSDMNVISNASCTTNCLAPIAKLLDDEFGIDEGLMTTVHAQTASQNTVDGINIKKPRLGRSGYNIIPSTTGAASAVGEVIPSLKGKLTGMSFRVPTTNVSVVDLTVKLKQSTTLDHINEKVKEYSSKKMKGVLGYTDENLVSSDFIGDYRTSILDIKSSMMLSNNFFKLILWYDNEWGYSCKTLDLVKYIHKTNYKKENQ